MKKQHTPKEYKETFEKALPQDFKTPKWLWNMGVIICNHCGKAGSIDYKTCNKCGREITAIVYEKV